MNWSAATKVISSVFEAMNAFISQHKLKPIVDRVFGFAEAPAAFEYLETGGHFGKVVVRL
jgi:NADPH:quinone reductase-like Zn-dependent oxidoreductase